MSGIKKHIVIFNDNISRSAGTERMTVLLANELSLRKFKLTLVCSYKGNGAFFHLCEGIDIEYLSDLKLKHIKHIFDIFCLRKILKKIQPDIVISVGNMFFRTLPASIGLKHKLFSWHHNVKYGVCSKLTFKILNILMSLFSDKLILLSEANANFIKKKYNNKNIAVISNPITIQGKITPSSLQNKTLLYIGRICKEKGVDLLLQAWEIIYEKHPDWNLQIVGEAEKDFIFEKANCITINNAVADVKKFYEAASIFVIPSRTESLPLIVIEAKAFGLPIVSTNWGMNAKDMIQNGIDGFIVENFDVIKIAEKIMLLMENQTLRMQMGAESLKSSGKYTVSTIMDKWEDLFK